MCPVILMDMRMGWQLLSNELSEKEEENMEMLPVGSCLNVMEIQRFCL